LAYAGDVNQDSDTTRGVCMGELNPDTLKRYDNHTVDIVQEFKT